MCYGVFHESATVGKNTGFGSRGPGLGSGSAVCYLRFLGHVIQGPVFWHIDQRDAIKCHPVLKNSI